jgi:PIN domain nuclease of toxin-antitoxin system
LIVLDTHTWVWWVAVPEQLSAPAREEIDRAMERGEICISSISSWEVALLVRKGRLELTIPVDDWIAKSEALPFIRFVPLDNRIAFRSNYLPGELHEDPADRIIVATALTLGAPLVSRDTKIRDYPHVKTIW